MRRTWIWTFDLPPEQLWPVLADTNRFNEAMGLPPYELEETPQANGTVLRRGSGKAAGFILEWEEKPYEWIHGRHFRQARLFSKGPFRRFGPVFDLEPYGDGDGDGSKVTYTLEWEPLSLAGRLFGGATVGQIDALTEGLLEPRPGERGGHLDRATLVLHLVAELESVGIASVEREPAAGAERPRPLRTLQIGQQGGGDAVDE